MLHCLRDNVPVYMDVGLVLIPKGELVGREVSDLSGVRDHDLQVHRVRNDREYVLRRNTILVVVTSGSFLCGRFFRGSFLCGRFFFFRVSFRCGSCFLFAGISRCICFLAAGSQDHDTGKKHTQNDLQFLHDFFLLLIYPLTEPIMTPLTRYF